MATEVGTAYVTLIPSAKGFAAKMQSELGGDISRVGGKTGSEYGDGFSKSASKNIGGKTKAIFGSLAKGGLLLGAAAGVAVGKVLSGSISEARDAQVITARTENVIKSMGNASNISAAQVGKLAESLSNKTAQDDEAIQSGQNLLLTFGNVRNEVGKGNDIFNQTSGLMVDMSVAMGQSMKGSAIQLGKALNDPTKGVSALSRVGVSFTEQQKDQIKTLQASGDVMGAQKVILGEVQKQFGGAGAAMATPAEKAKVAWGNFQESIGTAILPLVDKVLTKFSEWLPKILDFASGLKSTLGPVFTKISDVVQKFFGGLDSGTGNLGSTVSQFRSAFETIKQIVTGFVDLIVAIWQTGFGQRLITVLGAAFEIIKSVISGALDVIKGVITVVTGLIQGDWGKVWDGIKSIVRGVWTIIESVIRNGFTIIKAVITNALDILRGIFTTGWGGIKTLVANAIDVIVGWVKAIPGKLSGALSNLAAKLGGLFESAFGAAKTKVINVGTAIVEWVANTPQRFVNNLSALLSTVRNIFSDAMSAAKTKVIDIGTAIVEWIAGTPQRFVNNLSSLLGTVRDIFANVMDAAASAVSSGVGRVVDVVRGIKSKITGALSGAGTWLTGIGRNIVEGLGSGIDAMYDWIRGKVDALAGWIPGWVKKKLGIASPSKVMKVLGGWIGKGLAEGITDSSEDVGAGLESLRKQIDARLDAMFDGKKLKAKTKAVTSAISKQFEALRAHGSAQDLLTTKLDEAKAKLTEAIETSTAYAQSIRNTVLSFGSVVGLGVREIEEGVTAITSASIIEDLAARATAAQDFTRVMAELTGMQLNQTTLDQLYQAGPEAALATAQALAAGGVAAVAEVNALTSQIDVAGSALGTSAAATMHGAAVLAAQNLVDGFVIDQASLDEKAADIVRQMVQAVEKASEDAGIDLDVSVDAHKPKKKKKKGPKKLASGGRATGATLAIIGEGREPETVLPDSMLRGLLERTAAGAGGPSEVRVFIGDRELTDIVRFEVDGAQVQQVRQLAYGRRA